jgi:hypothetical protein
LKLPGDGWNGIESFDHLVGAGEQCRRHVEAERFRGLALPDSTNLLSVLSLQRQRMPA